MIDRMIIQGNGSIFAPVNIQQKHYSLCKRVVLTFHSEWCTKGSNTHCIGLQCICCMPSEESIEISLLLKRRFFFQIISFSSITLWMHKAPPPFVKLHSDGRLRGSSCIVACTWEHSWIWCHFWQWFAWKWPKLHYHRSIVQEIFQTV